MFEIIKNNPNNTFYSVNKEMIITAEQNMGIIIPSILKSFYEEIGYGFLETKKYNINRIMGPSSIEEFRLCKGQFENSDEVEILEKYTSDKVIFFEVNESLYLSIGIAKGNIGKVFYYDEMIAETLDEFFERYITNERYFLG